MLLSTDPVKNREFEIEDGVIVGVGLDGFFRNHKTGGDARRNAKTIQLMPFNNTPNGGGEFKVWVTPVGKFVGDPNRVDNPSHFHGFVCRHSKTDNFKVRANWTKVLVFGSDNGVVGDTERCWRVGALIRRLRLING